MGLLSPWQVFQLFIHLTDSILPTLMFLSYSPHILFLHPLCSAYVSFARVYVYFYSHMGKEGSLLAFYSCFESTYCMCHAGILLDLVVPFLLCGIHSSWAAIIVILHNLQAHWKDPTYWLSFSFLFLDATLLKNSMFCEVKDVCPDLPRKHLNYIYFEPDSIVLWFLFNTYILHKVLVFQKKLVGGLSWSGPFKGHLNWNASQCLDLVQWGLFGLKCNIHSRTYFWVGMHRHAVSVPRNLSLS